MRQDLNQGGLRWLCGEINRRTGLPIALDHHYKFLILLPLESDPYGNMEAQKHLLRGADERRAGGQGDRDEAPRLFIIEFQGKLILDLTIAMSK